MHINIYELVYSHIEILKRIHHCIPAMYSFFILFFVAYFFAALLCSTLWGTRAQTYSDAYMYRHTPLSQTCTHPSLQASQSSIAASTLAHFHQCVCIHVCINAGMGEKKGKKQGSNEKKGSQWGGHLDFHRMPCREFIEFTCVNPVCLWKSKVAWSPSCPVEWCNTPRSSGHVLCCISEWRQVERRSVY